MSALQDLIDETDDGYRLELNYSAGKLYAIAVIDSEYDEVAVLEEADLTPELIAEAEELPDHPRAGAIAWPAAVPE